MNRFIETNRFFSAETQRTFYESIEGYINNDKHFGDRLEFLKKKHNIEEIHRLDLGQNPYGSSPLVFERLHELLHDSFNQHMISQYPDFNDQGLRHLISRLHGIRPEWITLSAGLEQMIDLLAAMFFNPLDRFLTVSPDFFVFDKFSRKHGGVPILIQTDELRSFEWNGETTQQLITVLRRLSPKIVWISNPNNPTGKMIGLSQIEEIVQIAQEYMCFIVIDEAYGEYADSDSGVVSCSALTNSYKNLICLRTFSKAYGLAGMRVGYAITSNPDISRAILNRQQNYPITRLSYEACMTAIQDQGFIARTRKEVSESRQSIYELFKENPKVEIIKSESQTFLLRLTNFDSKTLYDRLLDHEILTSPIPGDDHVAKTCLRVSVGRPEAMKKLTTAIRSLTRQNSNFTI